MLLSLLRNKHSNICYESYYGVKIYHKGEDGNVFYDQEASFSIAF